MNIFEIAIWGAFGALAGEMIKAWERLRGLSDDQLLRRLRSLKFWVMVIMVVIMGAIASVIVNSPTATSVTHGQALAAGLGAFGFLRGLTGVAGNSGDDPTDPNFGPSARNHESDEITWKDVF